MFGPLPLVDFKIPTYRFLRKSKNAKKAVKTDENTVYFAISGLKILEVQVVVVPLIFYIFLISYSKKSAVSIKLKAKKYDYFRGLSAERISKKEKKGQNHLCPVIGL